MVVVGERCPKCGVGTVRNTSSPIHGPFLGCSTFDKKTQTGCPAAWDTDGGPLPGSRSRSSSSSYAGSSSSSCLGLMLAALLTAILLVWLLL